MIDSENDPLDVNRDADLLLRIGALQARIADMDRRLAEHKRQCEALAVSIQELRERMRS